MTMKYTGPPNKSMEIEILLKLVHFHITPALFYISGVDMRTKHNFMF